MQMKIGCNLLYSSNRSIVFTKTHANNHYHYFEFWRNTCYNLTSFLKFLKNLCTHIKKIVKKSIMTNKGMPLLSEGLQGKKNTDLMNCFEYREQ